MIVTSWPWFVFAFICGAALMFCVIMLAAYLSRDKTPKLPEGAPVVLPEVRESANPLLVPPPMVGEDTVMKWALHYHRDRLTPGADASEQYGVWATIVERMYTEASRDLGIARHFGFTDMPLLQAKMTSTLCLVLDVGLRQNTVERMKQVHARYDITEREYDRLVEILCQTLAEYLIPRNALDTIRDITGTLKPAIVKPQAL